MRQLPTIVSILLLLTGLVSYREVIAQDEPLSPLVIAQGIVTFTEEPVDWRVFELEADPDLPREPVTAAAGFTYVDDGGLIVSDANSGHESLLRAGEAAFSNDGDLLSINTEAGSATNYRRIVLLPDEFADEGGNEAAFESDGFTVVAGKREVEFAIGALTEDNQTYAIAAGETGTGVILILSGEATVSGSGEPIEVSSGNYLDLTEGIDITTDMMATFAVVRIGSAIRDITQPVVADDEPALDGETPAAVETPAEDDGDSGRLPDVGTGSLTLQVQICSLGGSTGGCSNDPNATTIEISGAGLPGSPVLNFELVPNDAGEFYFPDLPYGEYFVQLVDYVPGEFEVVGAVQIGDPINLFKVTIDADFPNQLVSVRKLPPGGEGVISVELYVCPSGIPAAWAQPWFCSVDRADWSLSLTSEAFAGRVTTAEAPASESGFTFSGLPLGYTYRLSLDIFPTGYELIQIKPDPLSEGPVWIELETEYSIQTYRFYAVTTSVTELSGPDTDGDELPDDFEATVIGTDPALPDTDGDSVTDGTEVRNGNNPFDPADYSFG